MPSLDRHAKEEDVKRLFLIERLFIAALILFLAVGQWVAQAHADQLPFPEPANENAYAIPSENLRLRVWAQYRVMYNASNIPSGVNSGSLPAAGTGPGQLNFGDTTGYDFLRQRMRLAFDIQQKDSDNVGLYMQVEYRGGFGGSSPAASDPRGETGANADGTANAFNDSKPVGFGTAMSMSRPLRITHWSSVFCRPSIRSDVSCGMVSGISTWEERHLVARSAREITGSAFTASPRISKPEPSAMGLVKTATCGLPITTSPLHPAPTT